MLLKATGKSYLSLTQLLMEEKFHSDAIITGWRAVIGEQERGYVSVRVNPRRGDSIPIDDEERLSVLENFIEIFETNELDSVLISSLQSILGLKGCSGIF